MSRLSRNEIFYAWSWSFSFSSSLLILLHIPACRTQTFYQLVTLSRTFQIMRTSAPRAAEDLRHCHSILYPSHHLETRPRGPSSNHAFPRISRSYEPSYLLVRRLDALPSTLILAGIMSVLKTSRYARFFLSSSLQVWRLDCDTTENELLDSYSRVTMTSQITHLLMILTCSAKTQLIKGRI